MRISIITPTRPGALGLLLGRGLDDEGHDVSYVSDGPLLGGDNLLLGARRLRLDRAPSAFRAAKLRPRVVAQQPDVVIVIKGLFLSRPQIERLRRETGAAVVNYYPDDPFFRRPARSHAAALRAYDCVFLWSNLIVDRARSHGVNAQLVPFGYDPTVYKPYPEVERAREVAFVGRYYPIRHEFLEALADRDLIISGYGWRAGTRGSPLARAVVGEDDWEERAARLYCSARVGVNVLVPQCIDAHNMRTWELPATGTPTVASRSPDHERIYGQDGAVLFSTPDELRVAVERLLADDRLRALTGESGRRAVASGTYRQRAREILALLQELSPRPAA
jgi:glycosyltransferase involved in cell wall biosynthesis